MRDQDLYFNAIPMFLFCKRNIHIWFRLVPTSCLAFTASDSSCISWIELSTPHWQCEWPLGVLLMCSCWHCNSSVLALSCILCVFFLGVAQGLIVQGAGCHQRYGCTLAVHNSNCSGAPFDVELKDGDTGGSCGLLWHQHG